MIKTKTVLWFVLKENDVLGRFLAPFNTYYMPNAFQSLHNLVREGARRVLENSNIFEQESLKHFKY